MMTQRTTGIVLKLLSVCAMVAMSVQIKLIGDLPLGEVVFVRSFIGVLLILTPQLSGVTSGTWALVTLLRIGAGLAGGLGQLRLSASYRHADMSVIAPLDYSAILVSSVLGMVVFTEIPDLWVIAGASVLILSGIVLIREKSR